MHRLFPITILLAGCPYVAPLDPNADPLANGISGTVLLQGIDEPDPVILFLSDIDNPMPPEGTGSPVLFTTVPGTDFPTPIEGTSQAGFAFTQVPDGEYRITALMDKDWDFHPLVTTLAGATCNDRLGGLVNDLAVGDLGSVEVSGGVMAENLVVVVGAKVPFERPAFRVQPDNNEINVSALGGAVPLSFTMESVRIEADYGDDITLTLEGPLDEEDYNQCDTAFWIHVRDVDGDGLADSHPDYDPLLGLLDIWPRVYLEYFGENGGSNVWVAEAFPYLLEFGALAAMDPVEAANTVGVPFPVTEVSVMWIPGAQAIASDGTVTVVEDPNEIPLGPWTVTVIEETGQTWTVPNDLGSPNAPDVLPGIVPIDAVGQSSRLNLTATD